MFKNSLEIGFVAVDLTKDMYIQKEVKLLYSVT